jgi:plastocyanin
VLTGFVLAWALAACGSSDSGSKRTVTARAGQSIQVKAREYSFDPGRIVVPSGDVRISLTNSGSLAHDLRVEENGRQLGGTPIFQSGETKSATLHLKPGTYRFVCTVGDHEQLGMKGTLVVR